MVDYIKYTSEVANDWKQVIADVQKDYPHLFRRILDCSTSSQLQSKLWMVTELSRVVDKVRPFPVENVALLGGWYANFSTELLISNLNVQRVHNYEFDVDSKPISYKFNKRHKDSGKYICSLVDIMWEHILEDESYDIIINTSCEHMYPMTRFYELNKFTGFPLYVLQSTDDAQWDDHINCVSSEQELSEQADLVDVLYSGRQKLDNGMNRFMVIGYPSERYVNEHNRVV